MLTATSSLWFLFQMRDGAAARSCLSIPGVGLFPVYIERTEYSVTSVTFGNFRGPHKAPRRQRKDDGAPTSTASAGGNQVSGVHRFHRGLAGGFPARQHFSNADRSTRKNAPLISNITPDASGSVSQMIVSPG